MVCMCGRRRSASTSIVGDPASAKVIARLAIVVDLPSSGLVEVARRVCTGLSGLANWIFVRSVRYASAAADLGSAKATRPAAPSVVVFTFVANYISFGSDERVPPRTLGLKLCLSG